MPLALLLAFARPPTLDPSYGIPVPPLIARKSTAHQDSHWIWAAVTKDNQTVYFRKRFSISSAPKSAELYITADNDFELTVDGSALTVPKATDEGWKDVQSYDLSDRLRPGQHEIDVTGKNFGGVAGLLARLEVNGKPMLLTDRSWQVSDASSGPFVSATVEDVVGGGPWGRDLNGWPVNLGAAPYYLHTMLFEPIAWSPTGPDPDQLRWKTIRENLVPVPASDGVPRRVVIDFGQELSGSVSAMFPHPYGLTVKLGTGESAGEAMKKPWTSKSATSPKGGIVTSVNTAFRYACVELPASSKRSTFKIIAHFLYYPVAYRGSFACSDPLLTKIWYTGAYTAHLCMQDDIWDAPKRDRARWMGDLHVSGETINNVFLDRFLMEQTMSRLRQDAQGGAPATAQPKQHVNGIPGYSSAWISGLADFYRHTGDLAYIKNQHEALITLLEYMRGDLQEGLFANNHKAWPFVDWSPDFDKDSPQARAATDMFLIHALREAAFLFNSMGDDENRRMCLDWAHSLVETANQRLRDKDGTFGRRRQENAMAVYADAVRPADRAAIYRTVLAPGSSSWKQVATPYYDNYVIFAMSMLGHTEDAMNFVRRFWGGMIREGATSFWESYDPTWNKHDFHAHLNADDGTGYFVSLCHGWSSGVTNWLTERVLGVRPTGGGFSTCVIEPDLGDLGWASGFVPTPHGLIHVRASRSSVTVRLPKGVRASIVFNGRSRTLDSSRGPREVTVTRS